MEFPLKLIDFPVGIAIIDKGILLDSNDLWNKLIGSIDNPTQWTSKIGNGTTAFNVKYNLQVGVNCEVEFSIDEKNLLFYFKSKVAILIERKPDPVQTLLMKLLRNQLFSIQSKNGLILIKELKEQLEKFSDYLPTDALRDAENISKFKNDLTTDVVTFKLEELNSAYKSDVEYNGDLGRLKQIIENIQSAGFLVSQNVPLLFITEKNDFTVTFTFSPIFFSANIKTIASKRLNSSSILVYNSLDEIGTHLFIAKALVESLGVTLDLSEKDTLSFSLKLKRYSQQALSPPIMPLKRGLIILIVEDNELSRRILKRFLEKEGEKVIVATDGNMAYDIYNREHVDMIFMDIELPFMNGIDTTIKIRTHEKNTGKMQIPIVALSGIFFKDYKERSIKAGMSAFLEKPYVFTEIRQMISDFFKIE